VPNAIEIAAGLDFGMVLGSNGKLYSWGNNNYGQLGDVVAPTRTQPFLVPNLNGVVGLTSGSYHVCALINDGTVRCWGQNTYGQLGNGSTAASSTTPVTVSNLSNVQSLAQLGSSALHSCAVLTDRTARCWGGNWYGQLGDGTQIERRTPVQVIMTDIEQMSGGADNTCARTWEGYPRCWGLNAYGMHGNNSTAMSLTPVAPVGASVWVATVSVDYTHTCIRQTTGAAMCWGYNYYGHLGDGTTTNRIAPATVTGF
jgi:alpha-tubulin suppressor-like RCC1 family protein